MKIYQKLKGLLFKKPKTTAIEYDIFNIVYPRLEAAEFAYAELFGYAKHIGHVSIGFYENLLVSMKIIPSTLLEPDDVWAEIYGWTFNQLLEYMTINVTDRSAYRLELPIPVMID